MPLLFCGRSDRILNQAERTLRASAANCILSGQKRSPPEQFARRFSCLSSPRVTPGRIVARSRLRVLGSAGSLLCGVSLRENTAPRYFHSLTLGPELARNRRSRRAQRYPSDRKKAGTQVPLLFCGRSDRIRTCGLLVPNQAHYQAVPHPVSNADSIAHLPSIVKPFFKKAFRFRGNPFAARFPKPPMFLPRLFCRIGPPLCLAENIPFPGVQKKKSPAFRCARSAGVPETMQLRSPDGRGRNYCLFLKQSLQ